MGDLIGVFGAGLATFLTPCVLPLIPVYLAALVGGDLKAIATAPRGQLLGRALVFSVGFIFVFTLLGLAATALGGLVGEWKALIELIGAMLIGLFGLKFVGFIEIPLLDRVARLDNRRVATQVGALNALLLGIVFAAGWSPCVGPVLGSVLTYTAGATSDPGTGALYLATYGLGFALPLLVTAGLAELGVKALRRIAPRLPLIERIIGVAMLVVAVVLFVGIAPDLRAAAPPAAVAPSAAAGTAGAGPVVEGAAREKAALPTLMAFVSHDCPVCNRMKPVIESLKAQCDGKHVTLQLVDIGSPAGRPLARQFRLIGVPTFVFLDAAGHEAVRLVGEQTEVGLKQAVAAVRGEPCPGIGPLPADFAAEAGPGAACRGGLLPEAAVPDAAAPPAPACDGGAGMTAPASPAPTP